MLEMILPKLLKSANHSASYDR